MSKVYDLARKYTEKYKDSLQPCKYCGNTEITITRDRGIFDNRYYWSVNCSTHACDFTGGHTSIKQAIKTWNDKHSGKGDIRDEN